MLGGNFVVILILTAHFLWLNWLGSILPQYRSLFCSLSIVFSKLINYYLYYSHGIWVYVHNLHVSCVAINTYLSFHTRQVNVSVCKMNFVVYWSNNIPNNNINLNYNNLININVSANFITSKLIICNQD